VFWRACAAQFKLKSECAVFGAKTRCNISAICSYIFIYGRQRCVSSNYFASGLSNDFDFSCGLVLRQLFKRQVHSWFFSAKNLQPTLNLRPHSVYPSS